ncbi:hypothetical protein Harman_11690 [Haloarcula mannanilytica]|uniref:Uncharacterized protein n=1 Tax=Haloarcula mannanilytica TaxID=2509225 RepID=A0A4C2EFR9_9EURY|nr:hypothetical protein [Haloarcula mannanilytica]GCF13234.1 hypothetical protein Harman_11690 [Haloarcula mannanilytica]
MADINVSTLVPLILLVIAALANTSRQVKIIEVANEAHNDVYLLDAGPFEAYVRRIMDRSLSPTDRAATLKEDELSGKEPKLGRFNHIHAFNSFLIAVSQILIVLSENSLSGAILAGTIGVFWMVLPIIEIEEYDLMLRTFEPDDPLYSLTIHMVLTFILTVPAIALSLVDVNSYSVPLTLSAAVVYIVASVFVGNLYQSFLDDELEILRQRGIQSTEEK